MSRLTESKLACKLRESNKAGIITGLIIAVVVITLVAIAIMKIQWIKKQFCCSDCDDMYDDDFDLDFDDDCTCESDFV